MSATGASTDSPVPDAVGRVLQGIRDRLGVDQVDRVWIFPPLIRGRKEWGLIAFSAMTEEPGTRTLYTARYTGELLGTGTSLEFDITAEGEVPPDRIPRVMDGVVRRSDLQLGDAQEVEIEGNPERYVALEKEYGGPGDLPADAGNPSAREKET